MKNFTYLKAATLDAASKAAAEGATPKAGGTDLMDLLKERIEEPSEIVSLPALAKGGVEGGRIHAQATLTQIAESPSVQRDFPALHTAAAEAATPQVRNRGTVGGNLCQHTRCWYFRNKDFECWKRGGEQCDMLRPGAQSRYAGVVESGTCGCAHPSNLAPAVLALGGQLAIVGPTGRRAMDAAELYHNPIRGKHSDVTLRPGELIEAVVLEANGLSRNSTYIEVRERTSFDFAVVAVGAALQADGGKFVNARVWLGGVAPTPYHCDEVEQLLLGKPATKATVKTAAAATLAEAKPLEHNGYKVTIARRIVRAALEELL
jgi:xanthine dehydrogenase YagS FAD-binding subunit